MAVRGQLQLQLVGRLSAVRGGCGALHGHLEARGAPQGDRERKPVAPVDVLGEINHDQAK